MIRPRGLHWGSVARLLGRSRRPLSPGAALYVFLCVADHYEPMVGGAPLQVQRERVDRWLREFPPSVAGIQDSRGRPPQHTFFYPAEEYNPEHLEKLAGLCRQGLGDVEVHLHHDNDTAENLRETVEVFKNRLFCEHGLLRKNGRGEISYGFVHGNWALCNSRPDGRWCGVNNELTVLRETGCYADFTMPSAPSPTQTRTINSIYYATDAGKGDSSRPSFARCPPERPGGCCTQMAGKGVRSHLPERPGGCCTQMGPDPFSCPPKAHDVGTPAQVGVARPEGSLLLIQGPLMIDWGRRKWGVLPRLENADLHGGFPPTMARLDLWLRAGVGVVGRPNWIFVKLHTHGAPERNADTLLGEPMRAFYQDLAKRAADEPSLRYYYVTAREMADLVHQAERGAQVPEFAMSANPSLPLERKKR